MNNQQTKVCAPAFSEPKLQLGNKLKFDLREVWKPDFPVPTLFIINLIVVVGKSADTNYPPSFESGGSVRGKHYHRIKYNSIFEIKSRQYSVAWDMRHGARKLQPLILFTDYH